MLEFVKRKPRLFINKAGWHEVGGKKIYFRSRMELRYAKFLEFQKKYKQIQEWEYEPRTFWFENIKRGVRSYTPDFRILHNDGSHSWVEVKGFMDTKSRTKLKRMEKYYPHEDISIVGAEFFKNSIF